MPPHCPRVGARPSASRTAVAAPSVRSTITRIASWLNHGEGGYRELSALAERAQEPNATQKSAAPAGAVRVSYGTLW